MKGSARILFLIGLAMLALGVVIAVLELTGIFQFPGLKDPAVGAFGLILVGLSLMMLVRARERFR